MAGYRRRKPLVSFEYGTRIYAPSEGEPRYRVVAGRLHTWVAETE